MLGMQRGPSQPAGRGGELLYLKDWHFASEWPDYQAYSCPAYFQDDWLNFWLDSRARAAAGSPATATAKTSDYRFVYLGPAGTATGLHADVLRSHSWSANVAGRKRWRLLPRGLAHLLLDRAGRTPAPHLFADLHGPQAGAEHEVGSEAAPAAAAQFPGLGEARRRVLAVEQLPGEAIFVPSGWWHSVDNVGDCLSINHNWVSTSGLPAAWGHLREERAAAAAAIQDCRALCTAHEFESLVQRNAAANCGMGYAEFAAMLGCGVDDAGAALRAGGGRPLGGLGSIRLTPKETMVEAEARLRAAHAVLTEVWAEQAGVNRACAADDALRGDEPGAGAAGSGAATAPDRRRERQALIEAEGASARCLERICEALRAVGLEPP